MNSLEQADIAIGERLASNRNAPVVRSASGVAAAVAVGGADAGKTLVKRCYRRTRPHVLLDEGRYESDAGGSDAKREQSFPSGHVAGTVAAGRAISRIYPEAAPWCAAAALLIAGARLAKGSHWPLDVAAGAVIGLAAELATSRALRSIGRLLV
jgi:membrane-associated phospholipid phosphatase